MFADCVGFTSMSKEVEPEQVMRFLHSLYMRYARVGVGRRRTLLHCVILHIFLLIILSDAFKPPARGYLLNRVCS